MEVKHRRASGTDERSGSMYFRVLKMLEFYECFTARALSTLVCVQVLRKFSFMTDQVLRMFVFHATYLCS